MIEVTDAMGRSVRLSRAARRVVSLVPSITETLFALGRGSEVVGCTSWCLHPAEGVRGVVKIGGTKDPHVQTILTMKPDLVFANKEENRKEDVEALAGSLAVHVSYPRDLESVLKDLVDIGTLVGAEPKAEALVATILAERRRFRSLVRPAPRVAYLIWRKPWMVAAGDTFIDAMIAEAGLCNALRELPGRYPEIDLQSLAKHRVDAVFLSSEPFPFEESHRIEVAAATGLPISKVVLVSGEAFSWFGTRTATVFEEAERIHALLPKD